MKKASAILAIVMFMTTALFAADLTGTWNATVKLGDQQGTPTFVLKQDGDQLTGTYSGALGEAPIKGTVKGDEITIDFDASGAAVHYQGKVDTRAKSTRVATRLKAPLITAAKPAGR